VRAATPATVCNALISRPLCLLATARQYAHLPHPVRATEPTRVRWLPTALMCTALHIGLDDGSHG
jgi:hypothetical protein